MIHRRIHLPESFWKRIEQSLERVGYSVRRPETLAEAIRQLSDFYIQNPKAATPWNESWAQAAYLAYYFPLNFARATSVANEGRVRGFFSGLRSLVDFGTGLGTARFAFESVLSKDFRLDAYGFDRLEAPLRLQSDLASARAAEGNSEAERKPWSARLSTRFDESRLPDASSRLAVFSYTLTELDHLPEWATRSEAVALIEPSTRDDGRRLLAVRAQLIEQGFTLWAPCPHQSDCPLYSKSERDWCHDRIEWQGPEWWERMESRLPMKNRTLTFSYLLARRSRNVGTAAAVSSREAAGWQWARLVGDRLEEKGKTRQLVCRGPEREFLTWFPSRLKEEPLALERGELLRLRSELETRANELRLSSFRDDLERE